MKKQMHFALAVSAFVSLSILNFAATTNATTLERMSLERMTQLTKTIARVRCVSNATIWDSGEIWTVTTFDVQQNWRGTLPSQIAVRLLGGTLGGITSTVSGVPHFSPGQEAVLFLERTPSGDFSVVSWQQGVFRIRSNNRRGGESVTQDTASFATLDPRTQRMQTVGTSRMRLSDFRVEVEAAIAAAGGKP
ncbi:MAG TPA: hypothetical protein VG322_05295 [Candidatus Acidoferrales bacterium]|jgi:hypothetical protein|nr:hypothetical protein [Candidatus Acidoferrales bacterium]